MATDFTDMTDDELHELIDDASLELGKRQSRATFDAKIADVVREARGGVIEDRGKGEAWEPVTGYENVYFKGDEVEHKGKQWVSLIDNNALEPGVSGWREILEPDEDGNERYPVWKTPQGYQDAYQPGDRVWHPDENGTLYENTHTEGNAWEPGTPHSQWDPVDNDGEH